MKKHLLYSKAITVAMMVFEVSCFAQSVTVSTLSGREVPGFINGPSNVGQTISSFNNPNDVAVDALGNLYVADTENHKIRKITPAGVVTTFAGSGIAGSTDGTGLNASFYRPKGITADASNNLYIADMSNHKIRKITPAGIVTTVAGNGLEGNTDGTATTAKFSYPNDLVLDASGTIYVADQLNHKIRKISTTGTVSTLAGSGIAGSADGNGSAASFNTLKSLALDGSGNLYVTDYENNKIRKVTAAGVVTTLAGSGTKSSVDGTGTSASFNAPHGMAIDASGNIYVAEQHGNRIRKVTPTGVVSTLSGQFGVTGSMDGPVVVGRFDYPSGLAMDISDNLYISEIGNSKIRKITPAGILSTVAGSGSQGNTDGMATAALFNQPMGVAVDASGNLYVADKENNLIRKITTDGVVSVLAGSYILGSVNGTGTAATFNYPSGVAVDGSGNVYVADENNHKIRKITPAGVVSTLAGGSSFGDVDGTGTAARFKIPHSVAVDGSGNVYVADLGNNKIRKITPGGEVTTLAGSGEEGSDDGVGTAASFYRPYGVAVDGSGNVYVADYFSYKIRKITPTGLVSTLATGFNLPVALTVDGLGNVYVADAGSHKILKVTPAGVVTTLAGTGTPGSNDGEGTSAGFNSPSGIAMDGLGNLYVADQQNHKIRKITMDVVTGTWKQAEELGLRIYPNPSAGVVNLDLEGDKHLLLIDMNGQVRLDEASSAQSFQVNTLPKGIYLLKVQHEGKVYKGKLIVQ